MTAICAYLARGDASRAMDSMRRMSYALSIYGSDRYAEWSDGPIAMAIHQHQGLPEDASDQEPEQRDGVTLVADIRLDNRDDLRRELGLDTPRWTDSPDSALLREAWRRWGVECVHHLIGDFAFAIWSDNTQTLFCARDPLGMRPLCYATTGKGTAVASMPRGLLALPDISREPNMSTLASQLVLIPPETGRSHFRDVSLLPPGHTLRVTGNHVQVRQYWRPQRNAEIRFRRDEDYVDRFLEIFGAAVETRLRSSGPVASTLSAGLDSSSVTAVAASQLAQRGERLTALTWVPGQPPHTPTLGNRIGDERHHAASVVALHPNVDHTLVRAPDTCPLSLLQPFDDATGQPYLNPITLPIFQATGELLSQLGCRALLTGQFGNMTISYDGITLLPTLFRKGRWLRGIRETRALAHARSWSTRGALYTALGPLLPFTSTAHALWRRRGVDDPLALYPINRTLASQYNVVERAKRLGFTNSPGSEHNGWYMRTRTIFRFDMGMIFKGALAALGVEFRDPTSDVRILDYCLSIPETQFLRAGRTRWLIRRAMRGLLPSAVLDEQRRGLQASDWPRFIAPHREAFAAQLRDISASPLAREILDIPELGRLTEQWPQEWTERDMHEYTLKLLRGMATGSFILRNFA